MPLSPINPEFLKAFAARTLQIHCAAIHLRQNKADGGHAFKGPGVITLSKDEDTFSIRVYSEVHEPLLNWKLFAEKLEAHEPGGLLPSETYYSLEATSIDGHVWSYPRARINVNAGTAGTIVIASCPSLRTVAQPASATTMHVMHLVFFHEIDIPFNRLVETKASTAQTVLQHSISFTRAEIAHGGIELEFDQLIEPQGSMDIICKSEDQLPEAFERRIQEALRFMTFSPVTWSVCQYVSSGVNSITIIPALVRQSGLLPPPVPAVPNEPDFWRLFSCFLNHVCKNSSAEKHHYLVALLNPLFSLQKVQIEAVALTLGVATEGILNNELPLIAKPKSGLLKALGHLERLANRIKCDFPGLRPRAVGAIKAMRGRRPKDALTYLRDRGVITREQYRAWDELRNAAAHAELVEEDHMQLRINQCFAVYELILILTFLAIGYTGHYRQTSLSMWPIGVFDKALSDIIAADTVAD